jgi:DNA-binding cell septation regulator SpoVG
MISAMNFKSFNKGSLKGFFDLRYHGLTVKGCRLMNGDKGMWIALPQQKGTNAQGDTQYIEQLYLTAPETQHVRSLVLLDLQQQGHIDRDKPKRQTGNGQYRTPEGEDLSQYHSPPGGDDLPF